MGRAIGFDLDATLDAAMRRFWQGGYAATSLQDLLTATGLGAGSFYNTLKSKKALFLACLRRYGDTEMRARLDALVSAPTAAEGLRAMFRSSFDAMDDPRTPSRLCMMAGLVSPDVLEDAEMRAVVEAGQAEFGTALSGVIRRDQDRGALPASMDAEATASVIATFGQGQLRMALVAWDRARFERETELFLRGLGF